MKKKYQEPTVRIIQIMPSDLICTSDPVQVNFLWDEETEDGLIDN